MRGGRGRKQASGWVGHNRGWDQQPGYFLTVATVPGPPERDENVTGTNRGKVDVPGIRES